MRPHNACFLCLCELFSISIQRGDVHGLRYETTFTSPNLPTPEDQRSRERMKTEMKMLREQAIALEERLVMIARGDATGMRPSNYIMRVAWRTVAQGQEEQWRERKHLRKVLRICIKKNKAAIYRVRRYLDKMNIPEHLAELAPYVPNIFSASDVEEVSRWIQTMHTRLDSVFEDPHLVRLSDTSQDLRIQHDKTSAMAVEMRNARLVPFDVEATTQAIWMNRHSKGELFTLGVHEILHQTNDVIRRRYAMSARFQTFSGIIQGISEARRIVVDDGYAIVYCAMVACSSQGTITPADHIRRLHFCWTHVRTPRNHKLSSPSRPATQVEVVERAKPLWSRDTSGWDAHELKAVRDFCTEGLKTIRRAEIETLESKLLDFTRRNA